MYCTQVGPAHLIGDHKIHRSESVTTDVRTSKTSFLQVSYHTVTQISGICIMRRTTMLAIAVFALCWSVGFGTIVCVTWGKLAWWKLGLFGCVLAAILASAFAPNNRYSP